MTEQRDSQARAGFIIRDIALALSYIHVDTTSVILLRHFINNTEMITLRKVKVTFPPGPGASTPALLVPRDPFVRFSGRERGHDKTVQSRPRGGNGQRGTVSWIFQDEIFTG